MVPPLILFLAKHPLVDKFDLSSMVRVNSGAAPLGKELETAMLKRLPQVERIRQGEENRKCLDNLFLVKSICLDFLALCRDQAIHFIVSTLWPVVFFFQIFPRKDILVTRTGANLNEGHSRR